MKCPRCKRQTLEVVAKIAIHDEKKVDAQIKCPDIDCGYSASAFLKMEDFTEDQ